MKSVVALGLAAVGLCALVAFRPTRENNPPVGEVPPEIDAQGWINHLGPAPTLAGLRGQTVLIEFWATWCPPCRAAWPHLQALHEEYESKGLVVLGLSDEEPDVVSGWIDQQGITARVAYGSQTNAKYGVEGIPHTFIVGPNGKLAWHGHPSQLNKGILEDALKGAKARTGGFLCLPPKNAPSAALASVGQAMEQGKLGKAMQSAQALSADAKTSTTDKTEADALLGEMRDYVKTLGEQAERYVGAKDVGKALAIYDAVAKELAADESGKSAKTRADAIRKDPELAKEADAAEAFERVRSTASKLSTGKAKDKYKEFADKYKGTHAADRALALVHAKTY